jgi:tRNA-dihydrouridine synthase
MQENFWTDLYKKNKGKRPIIALAPMADVTDIVFRNLIAEKSDYGKVDENEENMSELDVLWTEFVSVNGLVHEKGREALLLDLKYKEQERPIVAQIFGEDPDKFTRVAALCAELGYDGVDINMGCPDKNVLGQKSGSYLINTPEIAKDIIIQSRQGVENYREENKIEKQVPITVKTRIGYNKIEYKEWLGELLKTKPTVLSLHLRTRKEMSLVPAHWKLSAEIVEWIRGEFGYPETGGPIIILNGDVLDIADAYTKWKMSGCDGIMIGRGIFGNPWLFSKSIKKEDLSINEILETAIEHTYRFEEELHFKSFAIMKKHFKAYVNGFKGAKELRVKMMEATNGREVEEVVRKFLAKRENIFSKFLDTFKSKIKQLF